MTDPAVYLCPSSGDGNARGALLRLGGTPPNACSYSGPTVGNRLVRPIGSNCGEWPIASDDDEGRVRFNHGDVIIVLYNVGFVQEWSARDPGVAAGFGKAPLLQHLAN